MENEILDQNVKEVKNLNYAGFGIRLLAFLIDSIIISGIGYLIWADKVVQVSENSVNVNFSNEYSIFPLAYALVSWIVLSSSLGKLVLGLKIVNEEGKRINPIQAFIRTLVYIIMFIGCWFILGNSKKKALHDIVANTFVVKK